MYSLKLFKQRFVFVVHGDLIAILMMYGMPHL